MLVEGPVPKHENRDDHDRKTPDQKHCESDRDVWHAPVTMHTAQVTREHALAPHPQTRRRSINMLTNARWP
jgi:hypothetical protein